MANPAVNARRLSTRINVMLSNFSRQQKVVLLCGSIVGCVMILPFPQVFDFLNPSSSIGIMWRNLQKPADILWWLWTQKLQLPPHNLYAAFVWLPVIFVFLQWFLPFVVLSWLLGRRVKKMSK